MKQKVLSAFKFLSPGFLAWAICCAECNAQCLNSKQFWDKIIAIEESKDVYTNKLLQLLDLKKQYKNCGLQKDSVYARLLNRIGIIEFYSANYAEAIDNAAEAVNINTSGKANTSLHFAANSYFTLGWCYKMTFKLNEALVCFDSSIILNNRFFINRDKVLSARLQNGNIYYKKGNFEKDIQETTMGISEAEKENDSVFLVSLLLERAQSFIEEEKYVAALNDVNRSLLLLQNLDKNNYFDNWANAYQYKAKIIAEQGNCNDVLKLYSQSIFYRKKVDTLQAAVDYSDAGLLFLNNCNNLSLAKKYSDTAYRLGLKYNYSYACMLAAYNMAEINFTAKNYKAALPQYNKALKHLLPLSKTTYDLNNPLYKEFLSNNLKSNAEIILNNKSKCLLYLYKQTGNNSYLTSCLNTAKLNDSVITDLRHEQTGEQVKLYWRNDTRAFFANAIEGCYLNKNPGLAFYFMEKSRSVLLNDKLNELGASADLPPKEELKKQQLLDNITSTEQKLSLLADSTGEYKNVQQQLFAAKEIFERYIQSIEKKYPAYYQYKYADDVPALQQLQAWLKKNNQCFIHYFIGDTATYILAITPGNIKFLHLNKQQFNKQQLAGFLQLCTNKQALNNNYPSFAALSNSIYKAIFQPLQLPKTRIIICADNIVIPFEALSADATGKNFLVKDYCFSYVYSARFLLKNFNEPKAAGNFLGFAPVSYATNLDVAPLTNAANALNASAAFYKKNKLFTNKTAIRKNFFANISSYSIINIFSHARADTSNDEPVLFMQDSLIYLSELQMLNKPATQLVLLSGCQTNVGKAATGEGIYSLARGFSNAGIPSVAGTLWKADEDAIYVISEKFNEYLSQGMNKDEALQKAKLFFIQNNAGNEKLLPYYWANMILIGNADALKLEAANTYNYIWIIVATILPATGIFFFLKRKKLK